MRCERARNGDQPGTDCRQKSRWHPVFDRHREAGKGTRVAALVSLVSKMRKADFSFITATAAVPGDAAPLAEAALAAEWSRPEENVAWSHLKSKT